MGIGYVICSGICCVVLIVAAILTEKKKRNATGALYIR